MCSLLYNYTSIKLFKNKCAGKISPQGDQDANVYHFFLPTLHLKY